MQFSVYSATTPSAPTPSWPSAERCVVPAKWIIESVLMGVGNLLESIERIGYISLGGKSLESIERIGIH